MPTDVKTFHGRSTARGLVAVLGDWAWIAAVIALAVTLDRPWLYPLWLTLIAVKQFAIGESLVHEASHNTLFAHRRLNDLVAPLVAWPFGYTLSGYRKEHLAHHRLLGRPEDPLAQQYARYGLRPKGAEGDDPPLSWPRALWIWVGRPLLGIPGLMFLGDNLPSLRGEREAWGVAALWAGALGVGAWGGWLDLLVLYWIFPLIYGFGALYYWSEVGDHYHVAEGHTRTITNPLGNWLTHHNGLHALHHHHPGIPWYNLPAAYAALQGTFPEEVSGSWLQTLRQLAGRREAA